MNEIEFVNQAAQGDVMIRRVNAFPSGLMEEASEGDVHIITHSETGHHHVIDRRPDVKVYRTPDALKSFLVIEGDTPVKLRHLRDYDTHKTLRIGKGVYEIRRQREYTAEGYRKAQD